MKCKKGYKLIDGKCIKIAFGDLGPLDYPPHSFRNFGVGSQFKEEIEECNKRVPLERNACRSNVRMLYKYVEAGRLWNMADRIHDFISRLDPDELKEFKNKFPDTVKIASEFGIVEDLRTF